MLETLLRLGGDGCGVVMLVVRVYVILMCPAMLEGEVGGCLRAFVVTFYATLHFLSDISNYTRE